MLCEKFKTWGIALETDPALNFIPTLTWCYGGPKV